MDFEQIYRSNVDIIYRYLFSLSQDADLAEDLTSQTFLEAIRGIHHYRGDAALSTYLCGIAKNLLYKEWEKRKRRQEYPLEEAEHLTHESTPEDVVLASLERQDMYKRIHALPIRQREVVYLRLSGELSFKEIGVIMEESETWARVTFYRAKLDLAKGGDENA